MKLNVFGLMALLLIGAYAVYALGETLALILKVALWGSLGITLVYASWTAFERVLLIRAARQEAQCKRDEARYTALQSAVIISSSPPGHQTYRTVLDPSLHVATEPLHLSPGTTNSDVVIYSETQMNRWQQYQMAHSTVKFQLPESPMHPFIEVEQPAQLAAPQNIVDLLAREQRLLLFGPSGSGKSSILRHVVATKLHQSARLILCDPHGARPKWGQQVDAVGFGEKYEEILRTFQNLEWLHKERIRQVEHGYPERGFEIVTVVIEEVQALVEYFDDLDRKLKPADRVNIGHYIKMFLTRTRKTAIDVVAVSQETTVQALGLKGFSKNRDAFAMAETKGRDGRGHKIFYTDELGQVSEYDPPAYWPDVRPVGVTINSILQLPESPSNEEQRVIDAIRQGKSNYKICDEVFEGRRSKQYYDKIEAIKAKFGL